MGLGTPQSPRARTKAGAGPAGQRARPASGWNSRKCRLQTAALAEACRRLPGTRAGKHWEAEGGAQVGGRNHKGLRQGAERVPIHCRLCNRALRVSDTGSDTDTERAVKCPFPYVSS